MKIRSLGMELFHADGLVCRHADRNDEGDSLFSQLWESASKVRLAYTHYP
jgi:hypothetical protein